MSRYRNVSMSGVLPISLSEIKAYFDIIELDINKDSKKMVVSILLEMDNEFIKRRYKNG